MSKDKHKDSKYFEIKVVVKKPSDFLWGALQEFMRSIADNFNAYVEIERFKKIPKGFKHNLECLTTKAQPKKK